MCPCSAGQMTDHATNHSDGQQPLFLPTGHAVGVLDPRQGGNEKPYGHVRPTLLAAVPLASWELAGKAVSERMTRSTSLAGLLGCSQLTGGPQTMSIFCICYTGYLTFLFLYEQEIGGGKNTWSFIYSCIAEVINRGR